MKDKNKLISIGRKFKDAIRFAKTSEFEQDFLRLGAEIEKIVIKCLHENTKQESQGS